jgi:hypothetical protein
MPPSSSEDVVFCSLFLVDQANFIPPNTLVAGILFEVVWYALVGVVCIVM